MRRGRRAYYDNFSRFYDRFVALHSRDRRGAGQGSSWLIGFPYRKAARFSTSAPGRLRFSLGCRRRSALMAE